MTHFSATNDSRVGLAAIDSLGLGEKSWSSFIISSFSHPRGEWSSLKEAGEALGLRHRAALARVRPSVRS